ncbi:MAG: response regulator [Bacteriovoracaceae bacterium]|nr:response regulator [Bacteriovoracaceae bacterium]
MFLFIDDEPDIHDLLADYLVEFGNQYHSAYSVPEALQFLQKNRYKLIVCDLVLENGKGENVLNYMRKPQSVHLETPVILISGKLKGPEKLDKQTRFLEKPFSQTELIDCLKGLKQQSAKTNLHPELKKLLKK